MCSGQLEGKIESAPILKDVFLNNKTFREMLLRALVTIIGKYSGCEYNKNRIWRKSEKFSQMVDGKKIMHTEGYNFRFFRMESTIILLLYQHIFMKIKKR